MRREIENDENGGHDRDEAQSGIAAVAGESVGHTKCEAQGTCAHTISDFEERGGQVVFEDQRSNAVVDGEGGGPHKCEAQTRSAPALSDVVQRLMELQVKRRFCISQQTRLTNSLAAQARWQLGFSTSLPEKEREAIRKQSEKLLKALKDGTEIPEGLEGAAEEIASLLALTQQARAGFDDYRKKIEKSMRELVVHTPGYEFASGVRGFGDLALAVVVSEAGLISCDPKGPPEGGNFPTVSKLWKRLGWAPENTYPKGEKSTGRKVPRRCKGELYGTVVEPLMKANADGKYKKLYDERKEIYRVRFLTEAGKDLVDKEGNPAKSKHAHKLAMRVMLKELLKDLWLAWKA